MIADGGASLASVEQILNATPCRAYGLREIAFDFGDRSSLDHRGRDDLIVW
jgi:hypothetical protein